MPLYTITIYLYSPEKGTGLGRWTTGTCLDQSGWPGVKYKRLQLELLYMKYNSSMWVFLVSIRRVFNGFANTWLVQLFDNIYRYMVDIPPKLLVFSQFFLEYYSQLHEIHWGHGRVPNARFSFSRLNWDENFDIHPKRGISVRFQDLWDSYLHS